MRKIKQGSTSRIARVFVQDTTSTTGAGLTGLTYASSGLVAYYTREGDASATAITLVAATAGTYTSGGFVASDGTNLPGVYEVGIPAACFASGRTSFILLRGATNMAPVALEVELDAVDYTDGAAFGLSRIDAAISTRLAGSAYTAPDTGATIAADLLNATAASYTTTGTIGAKISAAGSGGSTASQIATAVWQDLIASSDFTTAGSIGKLIGALAVQSDGSVNINMAQTVPSGSTTGTTGRALTASIVAGFGAETRTGTSVVVKDEAGTTQRTFTLTLDGSGNVIARS